jgi:DNA primase
MTTYIELKSVKYIDRIIQYAEVLLGIKFHRTGENIYMCRCPFHDDRKDSFSVYFNKRERLCVSNTI